MVVFEVPSSTLEEYLDKEYQEILNTPYFHDQVERVRLRVIKLLELESLVIKGFVLESIPTRFDELMKIWYETGTINEVQLSRFGSENGREAAVYVASVIRKEMYRDE
jgi:hypothetical protein